MEVSVRELKSRLSEYLRRVANGEEVIVTSHGKPVAQLLPLRSRRRAVLTETEVIGRFRGLPWVRPGSGKKPALPKPLIRIGKGEKTLAEIVSEQRG
ncbi:type II toxin-antitoxin system prevent-host-death family antitoxin [Methylocaldum sp.]|uniref:type II toxin-antitoxin system Phd/YefM family antitoxin n=1 Tax=Methylocaldum sp. TaxID=1969727 RepID=UPI0032204257